MGRHGASFFTPFCHILSPSSSSSSTSHFTHFLTWFLRIDFFFADADLIITRKDEKRANIRRDSWFNLCKPVQNTKCYFLCIKNIEQPIASTFGFFFTKCMFAIFLKGNKATILCGVIRFVTT